MPVHEERKLLRGKHLHKYLQLNDLRFSPGALNPVILLGLDAT